jgi:hypothetical protein
MGIRHTDPANFIPCQVLAVQRYQLASHRHLYKLLASHVILTEYDEVKTNGGENHTLRRVTHDHPAVKPSQVQLVVSGPETCTALGPLTRLTDNQIAMNADMNQAVT